MLNFIYNPTAGKGRAARFKNIIESRLRERGIAYTFWPTSAKGDAKLIAQKLTLRGESEIIAMGGDGTIHEVLNGITDPGSINMGIIPCGSGNDFAAAVNIPVNAEKALAFITDGRARSTDYMDCSGIRSLNVIGAGLDVEILKYSYSARFLKGSLNYFVSLLRAVSHFKLYPITSVINGVEKKNDCIVVCACNGTRIGGGIGICPPAVPDDSRLDTVIVNNIRGFNIIKALIKLIRKKLMDVPACEHKLTDAIKVTFDKPTTIQIDGELYEDLPFDITLVNGGIKLYRP